MSYKSPQDDWKRSKTFRELVVIAAIVAGLMVLASAFHIMGAILERTRIHEIFKIDEFIIPSIVLALALGVFSFRRWRELKQEVIERKRIEERLEHLSTVLLAIRNINQLVTRERNRDRLLQGICDNLVENRDYHNAWIALLDESGTPGTITVAGLGEDFSPMVERLKRGELTDCGRKALSQPGIVVEDPSSPSTDLRLLDKYSARGAMAVRLEYSGKVYGLLNVSIPASLATDEEEQALLEEVAEDTAFALHSMELEEKRRQAEEARQESEQRYRQLFEGIGDAVMVYDWEGRFLDCNEAVLQRLGYNREEFLPLRIADIVHPDFHLVMKINQERIWAGEIAVTESAHRCKDGRVIPVEVNALMVRHQGQPAILAVVRDITARKRGEEERERLLAELEAKNRELESFVYTVSHDLKAPLISLDGFSSALQKEFDKGKHYLERIQANVAHMDGLIRDLLDLSRVGQVLGPIEEIDVATLLTEIQEELAVELAKARAEFVVQEPLPAIHADRSRIRQVFANLIVNAIKFKVKEKPLRIEVGCQEERNFYRFHVADNGIGIAPQYHQQIFDPFRKLDPETEGLGMGLALVKKIVEHHGGRVWVESEEGEGAIFCFTLPTNVASIKTARGDSK
jgi:PAS domain S-box-containing protein